MTVKALRKQLMAAIAMVVVSAVALCSSTYAWFAANNKVTAEGMKVQATAEGGIEIVHGLSTETYTAGGTTANVEMEKPATLLPTSTYNTSDWYYAKAKAANNHVGSDETYRTISPLSPGSGENQDTTQFYDSEGKQYYLVKNFVIRSTATEPNLAKGLTVDKVSVVGATEEMSKALRVAVVLDKGKTLFYAPAYSSESNRDVFTYGVYGGYTGEGTTESPYAKTKVGDVTTTGHETQTAIANNPSDTIPPKGVSTNGGVDVKIYVYFEGEDENLTSEKFKTESLTIRVEFSATTGTTNNSQEQTTASEPSAQSDNEASGETGTI